MVGHASFSFSAFPGMLAPHLPNMPRTARVGARASRVVRVLRLVREPTWCFGSDEDAGGWFWFVWNFRCEDFWQPCHFWHLIPLRSEYWSCIKPTMRWAELGIYIKDAGNWQALTILKDGSTSLGVTLVRRLLVQAKQRKAERERRKQRGELEADCVAAGDQKNIGASLVSWCVGIESIYIQFSWGKSCQTFSWIYLEGSMARKELVRHYKTFINIINPAP